MSSKRKFTGVPFTPTPKCAACEQFEQCRNRDNILTSRQMEVVCEVFYYLFKRLEKFNKLPAFRYIFHNLHENANLANRAKHKQIRAFQEEKLT